MNLKPYQERVVNERDELADKVTKLQSFIYDSHAFLSLAEAEKVRLTRQVKVMGEYLTILEERIAAFSHSDTDQIPS